MTTTGADEVLDAEVLGRAATLRARAAGKAKAGAARGRRAAAGRLRSAACRLGRGLAAAPGDLVVYWGDLDGALDVKDAAPGDPTTKAKSEHETAKRRHRANVVCFVIASLGWCSAGWTALAWTIRGPGGWGVVAGWWLVMVGVTGITSMGVWKGKHKDGWLWPGRLWGAVAIAAAALFVHLAMDRPAWQLASAWLVPVLGWLTWAASDGEVFGDGQDVERAPETARGPVTDSTFERAVNESVAKLDPDDPAKRAHVLAPGITPSPNGKSYSVVIDTRGIMPAEALATEAARTALAAKLRVGANAVFPVVHETNAALATVTVLSPDAFGEPVTSALVTAESVDLWNPPPFMRVLRTGADIPLQIAGNNVGIGGMPDFGKSTTLNALILTFLLGGGKVKVIDGGEVDTEPFRKAGLLAAWCRDPKDAIDLMTDSVKEIEATQGDLAEMGKRKIDQEFFEATGTNFELLAWDELEAYANHPDPKIRNEIRRLASDYISRCRKTGRMLAWATQSASAEGVDANFRDKTIIRIGHYCSTPQMSDKILGARKASRGIDASTLPKNIQGAAWYLGRTETEIVRPHRITEEEVDQVIARLQRDRHANRVHTAADDDRLLAARVAELIKAEGVTVGDRRVMLARDVAVRFETDQMQLRAVLGRLGIGTQKVWRPDDGTASNRAHYVLTDFPAVRAI